jgi:hypothetical protein
MQQKLAGSLPSCSIINSRQDRKRKSTSNGSKLYICSAFYGLALRHSFRKVHLVGQIECELLDV